MLAKTTECIRLSDHVMTTITRIEKQAVGTWEVCSNKSVRLNISLEEGLRFSYAVCDGQLWSVVDFGGQ